MEIAIPDLNKKTILIVEDDEMSAKFLVELFEETGAQMITVDNASDALFTIHKNKNIDLVLMDIQLPDMNGWQATRIIKKVKKDLPVIVQSAYALESHIKKSFEAGCDYFVSKPIDSDILFQYVQNIFSKYPK
jgi:two-component system, cell cycle response regulator DivK